MCRCLSGRRCFFFSDRRKRLLQIVAEGARSLRRPAAGGKDDVGLDRIERIVGEDLDDLA